MTMKWLALFALLAACGTADGDELTESNDPRDECVTCDSKSDAHGIVRESYLAYGILELANTASFTVLDVDVRLDRRAAQGIVDQRPFEFIEQLDTVSYVGRTAFANLAAYAQAHGFVPSCGDGGLQPLLEACDDGNSADGDGCSAQCTIEDGGPDLLASEPDLIKGADIGVSIVNPAAYYLRERRLEDRSYPADVMAIFERADGIIANEQADERVGFDELAIMSKAPFYDSLFADEKRALDDAWAYFEISTAPPVTIGGTVGPFDTKIGVSTNIERPGPLVVRAKQIVDFEIYIDETVLHRLQQMPDLNQDGDPDTVELYDIDRALADYRPVFTADEIADLEFARPVFFEDIDEIASGGDFVITYDSVPHLAEQTGQFASFDGYEFGWRTKHHLTFKSRDDFDQYSRADHFDVDLYGDFRTFMELRVNSDPPPGCGDCNHPFYHRDVHFVRFDDTRVAPRRGLYLLEHWEGNERIYNRVVKFERTYEHDYSPQYLHEFAGARPMLADGTYLSLRKFHYQAGYDYFETVPVATKFNRTLQKLLPESFHQLQALTAGRYEEFEGVVVDVHSSRSLIAYINGCETPLTPEDSGFRGECDGTTVVLFFDREQAKLSVRERGQSSVTTLFGQSDEGVGLDTSYYVTR